MDDPVSDQLELLASERPDLVGGFLRLASESSANRQLQQVAKTLGIELLELEATAIGAARQLDALEVERKQWRHPGEVLQGPFNLATLKVFALARGHRSARPRRVKLELIARRLSAASASEGAKELIFRWTGQQPKPRDRDWATRLVADFLS